MKSNAVHGVETTTTQNITRTSRASVCNMQASDERIAEIEAADGVGATREKTMIGKGKDDDRVKEGTMINEMLVDRCKEEGRK